MGMGPTLHPSITAHNLFNYETDYPQPLLSGQLDFAWSLQGNIIPVNAGAQPASKK
jgi:ABC-type nitrate/sulfonate/bicarbonate transport system substrate-binding protein